ncbi:BppU family phage baseplate upper protein [Ligilactobacillus aviarius]|uniref:BppU family phage baseplate upper protein n=1 Tax=Ligilactobacillus aviarius TaxID=1606 RepID=UPI0024B965E4|nr:BppU family phage baseplate upper protein [Ligilactobacillus aviarius]
MADEYNNDIIQMLPGNDQTPPMYSAVDGESVVDRDSTGRIQSIKLDMTKAQNTFVDLRSVFNANQVDGKVLMPVSLYQYGQPFNLSGWTGEIHGLYPDKKTTFVLNTAGGNTGTIYNFLWDTGVFQTTGKYTFQFVFKNATTGETVSSKWCFFEVEPDILSMAVNFPEGIEPYDNEYQAWKSKVEAEINQLQGQINTAQDSLKTITGTATNTLSVLQDYEKNAQGFVDTAMTAKFGDENTWTGKQHFNGGLTFSNNAQGDTLVANTVDTGDLTATGNVKLPNTTLVNGEFELGNVLRLDKSVNGGTTTFLNATKNANASVQNWLWGERYNKELDRTNNPHFYLYMAFALDCGDVGKPFAQFASGFFKGCNPGPITIPIGPGSAMFHVDATSDTLVLDSVSNISGKVTVGTKIWI